VSSHDVTGLTVPVDDAPALAAAANRLAGDPRLRERLALAARAAARERFDHRAMARRILELYERVVSARRASADGAVSWAS
jgi:glycosyltransferase involved in cell wall biosynthesis